MLCVCPLFTRLVTVRNADFYFFYFRSLSSIAVGALVPVTWQTGPLTLRLHVDLRGRPEGPGQERGGGADTEEGQHPGSRGSGSHLVTAGREKGECDEMNALSAAEQG